MTASGELNNFLKEREALQKENKARPKRKLTRSRKIKTHEIATTIRQLAVMLKAGLPLSKSLRVISAQATNLHLKRVLESIIQDIHEGGNFSDALKKEEKIFGKLCIGLANVGESVGNLDEALEKVADYMERREEIRRKIRVAMSYPMVIVIVSVGALLFLLLGIVPIFAKMFEDFGAELPYITQVVMNISSLIRNNFLTLSIVIILFIWFIQFLFSKERFRYKMDRVVLKLPVLGGLILKGQIARLTMALGTLLGSGVSLLDSLRIVTYLTENRLLVEELERMTESSKKGEPLFATMNSGFLIPPIVIQMVQVGEETGELGGMFHQVADYYEKEVNSAIDSLTSIIEPIIIVILGVIIGGMLIAMYLPIFELSSIVQ